MVEPCSCEESLALRRQLKEAQRFGDPQTLASDMKTAREFQTTTAPSILTCSACKLGVNALHSGRCVTCWAAEAGRLREALERIAHETQVSWTTVEVARAALGREGT